MRAQISPTVAGAATVAGLVVGALGIGVLWASGVTFPIAIPPGIVVLLVGAVVVGLAPWRWAPGLGAFLGLFVIVGFLISPTGIPNFIGQHGTSIAVGTWIQLAGVLTALVTGVIATWNNYRGPVRLSR
jgi:hypothetical protein